MAANSRLDESGIHQTLNVSAFSNTLPGSLRVDFVACAPHIVNEPADTHFTERLVGPEPARALRLLG